MVGWGEVGWNGVGWGGLKMSMYACGTTSDVPFLHACTSTQCYDVTFLHACYVVKSVVHMRSEWTRKVRMRGKTKVAGTQQIDRCWYHLKKIATVRWRTAQAQPSMLDSGIESISGSIATICLSETWRPHARWKKRLLKPFVVWCRNWSLKKWQNVRRFGTWMSKTHGCVNPCYQVFDAYFLHVWCLNHDSWQ